MHGTTLRSLGTGLVVSLATLAGCRGSDEPSGDDHEAITNITPSPGVQQTISNCWDFASTGWIETLSGRPNGATPVDLSEAFVSYIYWYRQIVTPGFAQLDVEGSWGVAVEDLRLYGWMSEADFLSLPGPTDYASRHAKALAAVQAELATGALSTPAQRLDKANVINVLNRAWQLTPEVIADLTQAYGAAHEKSPYDFTGRVRPLNAIPVGTAPDGHVLTAADFVGLPADPSHTWNGARTGDYAWSTVLRPTNDADLRGYYTLAQETLLQDMPIPTSLMSDQSEDDATGTFQRPADGVLSDAYAHMVMIFDLSVDTPDFGLLPAGIPETRPAALQESLLPESTVLSFRARNSSWGTYSVPGQTIPSVAGMPGINDFSTDYLGMHLPPTPANPSGMALRAMVLPLNPELPIGK